MAIRTVTGYGTFRPGFSGRFSHSGNVFYVGVPNTPIRRRVCLFQSATKRLVAETWSDAETGAYSFTSIAAGRYFVVAFDYTDLYGTETESNIIVPEP